MEQNQCLKSRTGGSLNKDLITQGFIQGKTSLYFSLNYMGKS